MKIMDGMKIGHEPGAGRRRRHDPLFPITIEEDGTTPRYSVWQPGTDGAPAFGLQALTIRNISLSAAGSIFSTRSHSGGNYTLV